MKFNLDDSLFDYEALAKIVPPDEGPEMNIKAHPLLDGPTRKQLLSERSGSLALYRICYGGSRGSADL